MNVFVATCSANYRQRVVHVRYSYGDCAHLLRCSERCAAVPPMFGRSLPERRTRSTVNCSFPLATPCSLGAASVSFSSRRAYDAAVCPAFSRGAPRRRPVCYFVDKRVFVVVGYCSISMMFVLGVPLMKGSAVLSFSSRGPRPLLCSCRSHEHVFSKHHALAGGGVRPAFTGHVASSCPSKMC